MDRNKILLCLLLFSISTILGSKVEIVSQSKGHVTATVIFDEGTVVYDEAKQGEIIISNEEATIQTKDGIFLPATLLQVVTDNKSSIKVTTTPNNSKSVSMSTLYRSEKAMYPVIEPAEVVTTPIKKVYNGVTVQSVAVTPYLINKRGNKLSFLSSITITITFEPPTGKTVSNNLFFKTLKKSILNPTQLRYPSAPNSRQKSHLGRTPLNRDASYVKSSEKSLIFTIDNGVSSTSDQETDVEYTSNGLYRLTSDDLLYLGANIPLSHIRLRASQRHIYDSITPAISAIPHGLEDVQLLRRDSNNDGIFNADDEILFYASAMHHWYWKREIKKIDTQVTAEQTVFDTIYSGSWDFKFNEFDFRRYYWITVDAKAQNMAKFSTSGETGTPETKGLKLRRFKKSTTLTTPDDAFYGHSSRNWKWITLSNQNGSFSQPLELFEMAPDEEVGIRFHIPKKRRSYNSIAQVNIGEQSTPLLLDGGISAWAFGPGSAESFSLQTESKNGNEYFYDVSSYDTRYMRNLDLKGGNQEFHFYSDETNVNKNYLIKNLPTELTYVLRINESLQKTELIDTIVNNQNFSFTDSCGLGYEYRVVPQSQIKSPQEIKPYSEIYPSNLTQFVKRDIHTISQNHDYIIVSAPELLPHSHKFGAQKQKEGYSPAILLTTDLYREFSGGANDPTAIRNALAYIRANTGDLTYLLLFGGGHYSYKGLGTSEENYIFPYVDDNDILIEDFYAYLDPGDDASQSAGADMFVGRIPAKNSFDAEVYVDKYLESKSAAPNNKTWKNRVVLINDDDSQRGKIDPIKIHHLSSEKVNDAILKSKKDVQIQKINLFEYPFGGNFTKPQAKTALFSAINSGVSMINYFGHGAYHVITDEAIFALTDLLLMKNSMKYFVFSAFSCSVGFFDLPDRDALAAEILFTPHAGAIASVTSTRVSYATSNERFAERFYDELFDTTDAIKSLGMAFGITKNFVNLNRYALLGDPSYVPYTRRESITLSLSDTANSTINRFKVFDTITINGTVPVSMLNADSNFVRIEFQNQERLNEKRKDGGGPVNWEFEYDLPGEILYASEPLIITGNTFSHTLTIPRSTSQDTVGVNFKAFVWNETDTIAAGIIDTFVVSGINLQAVDTSDKFGPIIHTRLMPNDSTSEVEEFADAGPTIVVDGFSKVKSTIEEGGETVTIENSFFNLEFIISDSSGVDYFYENAGEGITASIESILPLTLLNNQFKSLGDDNKKGQIILQIPQSSVPGIGKYELEISARDILGNVTKEKYLLDIRSLGEEQYTIGDIFAYPSPVHMGESTRFWFNSFTSDVNRATLRIYTLDGRLLRTFKDFNTGIKWDLTDQRGNKLSPNVYLYRLFVEKERRRTETFSNNDESTEVVKSPIKKIVVYPPR